jgi:3'-phosphoadenosine 5'-phosphosulfate sulfotransferase (PAPS reductase)/FAD synthetase
MLWLTPLLREILAAGADCAISVSGGKDSQALLITAVNWLRAQGYGGQIFAIFADLGRAEWPQTLPFLTRLCQSLAVELVTVQREKGDLLDRFHERRAALNDNAPFWPSTSARYCTSDLKRQPIDHYLRRSRLILSLEGIRAQESEARAEKQPLILRTSITGKRYREMASLDQIWQAYQQESQTASIEQPSLFEDVSAQKVHKLPRLALTWYPLFEWSIGDVWQACGTTQEELAERRAQYQEGIMREDTVQRDRALLGWPAHPAYVMGARRLSCSLCFLGDLVSLEAGARHNPAYYRSLCWLEIQSGYSFQPARWLCDIAPDLLTDEMRWLLEQHPRRQGWLITMAQRAQGKTTSKPRRSLPVRAC